MYMIGTFIDGWYEDFSNADLFFLIVEDLDFDQIIWEFGDEENPDWVHVSYVSVCFEVQKFTSFVIYNQYYTAEQVKWPFIKIHVMKFG